MILSVNRQLLKKSRFIQQSIPPKSMNCLLI